MDENRCANILFSAHVTVVFNACDSCIWNTIFANSLTAMMTDTCVCLVGHVLSFYVCASFIGFRCRINVVCKTLDTISFKTLMFAFLFLTTPVSNEARFLDKNCFCTNVHENVNMSNFKNKSKCVFLDQRGYKPCQSIGKYVVDNN